MPDEVAILRSQAAKLTDAAMVLSTRGRPYLCNELRVLAGQLILRADAWAAEHGTMEPMEPLRIGEEKFKPLIEEYERLTGSRPYVTCWQSPNGSWRFNLDPDQAIFHDSTTDAENWLRWQVEEARRSGLRGRSDYGG